MKEFRQHNIHVYYKYKYTFFYYYEGCEVFKGFTGIWSKEILTEDRIDSRNEDSKKVLITK